MFTFDSFIIFAMTVSIVTSNILILVVLFRTEQLASINRYFYVSLTMADLCIGLFIAPFSLWTSVFQRWIYGSSFCHLEAYLAAIFWIASLYSLTWMSIDHYVAIRKPDRYESIMTRARCVCWVVFVWMGAFCFCCPPLFGVAQARYYPQAYICIIDWQPQKAYFITSGLLIIVPPIIALSVSNLYIFTRAYREQKENFEKCTDCNSRPELYFMNFVISIVYVLAWLPWCVVQLYESVAGGGSGSEGDVTSTQDVTSSQDMEGYYTAPPVASPQLHFYLMWLAVGNSFWKFVIYTVLDHDFRIGLKILYVRVACCRRQGDQLEFD